LYLFILSYLKIGRFRNKDKQKRFVNMSCRALSLPNIATKINNFCKQQTLPGLLKRIIFISRLLSPPQGRVGVSGYFLATSYIVTGG